MQDFFENDLKFFEFFVVVVFENGSGIEAKFLEFDARLRHRKFSFSPSEQNDPVIKPEALTVVQESLVPGGFFRNNIHLRLRRIDTTRYQRCCRIVIRSDQTRGQPTGLSRFQSPASRDRRWKLQWPMLYAVYTPTLLRSTMEAPHISKPTTEASTGSVVVVATATTTPTRPSKSWKR